MDKQPDILIVEDECIIAMEMKLYLEKNGYNVIASVDTGENAIEAVKVKPPDIILMDIRLKGKMNGIEAAEKICSKARIPIIFLTAFFDKELLSKIKYPGEITHILKPLHEQELIKVIRSKLYSASQV